MKSLNLLGKEINENGTAKCDVCGNGYYKPVGKKTDNNSCYKCSYCNKYIIFEKDIRVEDIIVGDI